MAVVQSRYRLLLFWFLVAKWIALQSQAVICNELVDPTWYNLVNFLDANKASGFIMLCPFVISGAGCPNQMEIYHIDESETLYMLCGSTLLGTTERCSITCNTTSFHVSGELDLESFTITGATKSAIVVDRSASLLLLDCILEGNQNAGDQVDAVYSFGSGGAVRADVDSYVAIQDTVFRSNQASNNGGAVFSQGTLEVKRSEFTNNSAAGSGGAMYGDTGYVSVIDCAFQDNQALLRGPAIFSNYARMRNIPNNTGCDNNGDGVTYNCNGVQSNDDEICVKFVTKCFNPTTAADVSSDSSKTQAPTSAFLPVQSSTPPPLPHKKRLRGLAGGPHWGWPTKLLSLERPSDHAPEPPFR